MFHHYGQIIKIIIITLYLTKRINYTSVFIYKIQMHIELRRVYINVAIQIKCGQFKSSSNLLGVFQLKKRISINFQCLDSILSRYNNLDSVIMFWRCLCPKKTASQLDQDLLTQKQSETNQRKPMSLMNPSLIAMQQQQYRNNAFSNRQSQSDGRKIDGNQQSGQYGISESPKQQSDQHQSKELQQQYGDNEQSAQYIQQMERQKYRNQLRSDNINYRKRSAADQQKKRIIRYVKSINQYDNVIYHQLEVNKLRGQQSQYQLDQSKQVMRLYCQNNHNQEFIYLNSEADKPIFFTFRMRYQMKQPLEYNLVKYNSKLTAIICKSFMINTKIDNLKKASSSVFIINYQKKSTNSQFLSLYQVVHTNDLGSFNFPKMQKIFILTSKKQSFQQILSYVVEAIRNIHWKDRRKVVFFFPRYLRLDQISEIIYLIFREQILRSDIQRNVTQFNFQIEFSDVENNDYGIVVEFKRNEKGKKKNMSFYDHVKTSLVIFGRYPSTYYTPLRQFFSFIKLCSIHEVALLRKLFHDNRDQFVNRVRQVKAWDNYITLAVQNEDNNIQQFVPERYYKKGEQFRISKEFRDDINNYFESEKIKESMTPVPAQWDDNLKADDIKMAPKNSNTKLNAIGNKQLQKELNIDDINNLLSGNYHSNSSSLYAKLPNKYEDLDNSDSDSNNNEFIMTKKVEEEYVPQKQATYNSAKRKFSFDH